MNSTLLAEDGEADFATSDKRHPSDFALWKSAKAGEPAWDSPACAGDPNAKGRPGGPAYFFMIPSLNWSMAYAWDSRSAGSIMFERSVADGQSMHVSLMWR